MTDRDRALQLCREIAAHPLHPSLDCTEIVDRFLTVSPTGQRRFIHAGSPPQWFVIWERGHWVPYVYHAVFVWGQEVFDPYWSSDPVPEDQYWDQITRRNPGIPLRWDTTLPPDYVQ
ncbi:hypothetical protein SAMN00768000_0247 [Sulfobacillus thermosulfidooxidans DSM 9293]|uniref:Uncharacterized protein n=1 Tax=Sulfobacillus thermosulfidooxidans (strain DSM 9293 / VKM B-1269 / AT-1) TaxID=929705 RepID=A0A1W1W6W7_SULTA|nr:hypothetical protein [Sulfobacillus thermosulfidooxidans]SMC02037.1 hypothetical protein SAMN00768000_0247 [Sulfobacillus thermosulfidooxidans DSM 9293]